MQLKVSLKNSKLGYIPNLSLPPGITCVDNVPCFMEGCYARNFYRLYPNVKNAWDVNLELYKQSPTEFFSEFAEWMRKHEPKRFRLFVGGDFPEQEFYDRFVSLVNHQSYTQFLVYTKRYGLDFGNIPENLTVVLSTWPGLPLPIGNEHLQRSWLAEDPRRPSDEEVFTCPGLCYECGHECWGAATDIVFHKH